MKKFNLNSFIYVRLTEVGIKELMRQHDELKNKIKSIGEFRMPATDENGYSKFQAHDLMRRFGHMLGYCSQPPFDIDVLFDDGDFYETAN